jgi:DNA-directed RNA polymerase subunit RPC12/RpoP
LTLRDKCVCKDCGREVEAEKKPSEKCPYCGGSIIRKMIVT